MLHKLFRILKYSSVVFCAQYAVFLVTRAILNDQKTKRDMSVVEKLYKKKDDENERWVIDNYSFYFSSRVDIHIDKYIAVRYFMWISIILLLSLDWSGLLISVEI